MPACWVVDNLKYENAVIDQELLRQLYLEEKLSAKQIADRLRVMEAKVVYWLRKYQIPKRSLSEAIYQRINAGRDPFQVKTGLNSDEEKLKVAGLILWVTEGSLKNEDVVHTSNSEPSLIRLFAEFLLRVCGVDKTKIRLRVLYYPDMEMSREEVTQFWAETTGLDEDQIRINEYQAVHNHRLASRYGTATLSVANVKLRDQMEVWLQELYQDLM
jgi:hypothetical protein